ncbi:hypothetical protein OC861_002025 [Tilletia horrida]|nr:hypothetical protein OC861_002025 [Tilletia horrida]
MTIEHSVEAVVKSSDALTGYFAGAGDDFMSHYATVWSTIRQLEMSAMDPKTDVRKLLARICVDEAGDELTNGQATSMDLQDPLQLELRRWPQAHIFLMHGLAQRGSLNGADAVFRALLRRSTSTSPEFENIQLHTGLLLERWAAVRKSAERLARSGHPHSSTASFVAKRANEVLALIGADPVAVPKEQLVAASMISVLDEQETQTSEHLGPTSRLLEELLGGVTDWSVEPQEAIKLYLQFRERWPLLCCHTGVLNRYLEGIGKSNQGPLQDTEGANQLLSTALAEFKGHLFAQHPELASLTPPSWRPPHILATVDLGELIKTGFLPSDQDLHRPAMNFGRSQFLTYAQTIQSAIRPELNRPHRISREVYLLIDQMLLCLVWMRHLGVQPKPHFLRQIVMPIRHVYGANGWEWPAGVQSRERMSSSGVVYHASDGMGPLSAWLAEWVHAPLPVISETARFYKGADSSRIRRANPRRPSLESW